MLVNLIILFQYFELQDSVPDAFTFSREGDAVIQESYEHLSNKYIRSKYILSKLDNRKTMAILLVRMCTDFS